MSAFSHFEAMDRQLVAAGFPATSPWWLETLRRFYASGRRQLVLRVGRRGGKSSTLGRVGVLEALAGDHVVPPGDLGIVAFISTTRDEAAKRLRTVESILRALNVAFKPLREGQGLELVDRPIAFQVFVASVAGVSGPTVICAIADEVAKWSDSDTGANPAKEVLASLRPTMATQKNARMFLSSSPLSTLDAHHAAFELGDTDHQVIAYAPTWIAHPELTEEELRRDEPDARIFRREYEAIPAASVSAAFDPDAVDRAFAPRPELPPRRAFMVVDPSGLRGDRFTWGVARLVVPDPEEGYQRGAAGNVLRRRDGSPLIRADWRPNAPRLQFVKVGAFDEGFWNLSATAVVDALAATAAEHGIEHVFSDQRESFALESLFRSKSLRFAPLPWTNANKAQAVERVRRWLADGFLQLPEHETLRRELHAFSEKYTPSGSLTFGARAGGHDDFVALLLTTAIAELEGLLPDDPAHAVFRGMGIKRLMPF